MTQHPPLPPSPPPAAPRPPAGVGRLMWYYMRAQWQRLFGLNVSQVEPLLLVGGQFSAAQWPALYALGVRAVLSLQAEHEDTFAGAPPPTHALRLHVRDYHAPTQEHLAEGVAFLAAMQAAELPTLVHCHAGVGRAPTTAAAYLVAHRGMPHAAALAYLRAARPIVAVNGRQLRSLQAWEARVRAGENPL